MSSKKTQSGQRRSLFTGVSVFAAAAAAMAGAPAMAQDAEEEEAIVVTGSRIARQDYIANSPIVTVGQEDLEITGAQTVDTLLNQLPQFVPGINQSSNNPSNGGQANLQLRGLGSNRTLILLDGRRIVPSTSGGSVDVNTVPAQMIRNIEVITGGASATYGSDAVGGVVNFLLRDFEGFEASVQYGQSDQGDGINKSISLAMGGEFDGGRGRGMLMLGWDDRGSVFNAARSFSAIGGPSGASPLGNTIFDAGNLPSAAAITAAVPGALPTQTFGYNNDGSLFSYTLRNQFISPDPGSILWDGNQVPGTTFNANFQYMTAALNELVLPLTRYNTFSHVEYDINENAQVYGEFLYTRTASATELAPTPAAGGATGLRALATNPWIAVSAPELVAVLASRPTPGGTFLYDKRYTAIGPRHSEERSNVAQITFGVQGDIGAADWTYDVYASFGRSDRDTIQTGNVSRGAVQTLLNDPFGGAGDEIFTPGLDADAINENVICEGGFDPFGETTLSAACQAYMGRTSKNVLVYEQRNIEALIQGALFELPAGEVRLALGADYREDTFDFLADGSLSAPMVVQPLIAPFLTGNDIAGFNPSANLAGETNVAEIFGEILLPIISEVPLIEELNLTLAGRSSNYNTVGRVETYKGDVDWTLVDGFRMRGSYQSAIRAPSVGELFAPRLLGFPSIGAASLTGNSGDPCDIGSAYRTGASAAQIARSASVRALCIALGVPAAVVDTYTYSNNQVPAIAGGNPNLAEETATTWSAGFVFSPRWEGPLERLSITVDYYHIEVEGAIGAIGVGTGFTQCFNAASPANNATPNGTTNPTYDPNNFFCQLFTRNPLNGNVTNFAADGQNLGGLFTSGVDFSIDWGMEIGPGDVSLSWVGNWLEDSSFQSLPGGSITNATGTIANVTASANPEYKWVTTLGYAVGPFSIATRWQYIAEMTNFNIPTAIIPETQYFDVFGTWDVTENLSLRAGVNNVTDEQPPVYITGVQANTDPSTYDIMGRRFFVGARARY